MKRWTVMALGLGILAMPTSTHANESLRQEAAKLFGRLEAPRLASPPPIEIELGRALFWDPTISANGKVSCASCHPASAWGADPNQFSTDAQGKLGTRNTPTIFNSMGQPALRWTGDRKNGAIQAEGSLTGSLGFATKEAGIDRVRARGYEPAFRAAYPGEATPLTPANYGRAIAAYQATLVTPGPFDRFLAGDDAALSTAQQAGLRAFIDTGCVACHHGPLLGGTEFKKFGVVKDYWLATGSAKPDVGRFNTTKQEEDRYVFRVPMLRNITKTFPYFHDGSVSGIDNAVQIMADVQLGKTLDAATTANIVAFLNSLTGEVPANYSRPAPGR